MVEWSGRHYYVLETWFDPPWWGLNIITRILHIGNSYPGHLYLVAILNYVTVGDNRHITGRLRIFPYALDTFRAFALCSPCCDPGPARHCNLVTTITLYLLINSALRTYVWAVT